MTAEGGSESAIPDEHDTNAAPLRWVVVQEDRTWVAIGPAGALCLVDCAVDGDGAFYPTVIRGTVLTLSPPGGFMTLAAAQTWCAVVVGG